METVKLYQGTTLVNEFSLKIHGPEYAKMAHEYAKEMGYTLAPVLAEDAESLGVAQPEAPTLPDVIELGPEGSTQTPEITVVEA